MIGCVLNASLTTLVRDERVVSGMLDQRRGNQNDPESVPWVVVEQLIADAGDHPSEKRFIVDNDWLFSGRMRVFVATGTEARHATLMT
jgi:hypothetical protein